MSDTQKEDNNDEKETQAQALIRLASDCEFFHDRNKELFVTFPNGNHSETCRIQSKAFKRWLVGRFYSDFRKPPGEQALKGALGVLESKALYEGEEHNVFNRIGEGNGNIYLDLCNSNWEVVKISSEGWGIVSKSPVKFIRSQGMLPLPTPEKGGNLDALKPFLNIDQKDWPLVVGFLVTALKPTGPYPILVLQGEQGSAKSSFARLMRLLIDPNSAPLRTIPREERDLMIAARNGWILNYDNLSGLRNWLSDSFCRLSTGGGFSTRELYSDAEEILFDSQRPLVLNGIDDIAVRGDLRDRSLILHLPTIPEENRRDEKEVFEQFQKACPTILGALLDSVVVAIKNLPSVKLNRLPRMADAAKWVTAAELAFDWEPGTFLDVYTKNRNMAVEIGLESDSVAQAIINHMKECVDWEGTCCELLDSLTKSEEERITRTKNWPKTPSTLSNRIRRLAPALRMVGINVEFTRKVQGRRHIQLRKDEKKSVTAVTQTSNSMENIVVDGSDAGDGELPISSDWWPGLWEDI